LASCDESLPAPDLPATYNVGLAGQREGRRDGRRGEAIFAKRRYCDLLGKISKDSEGQEYDKAR